LEFLPKDILYNDLNYNEKTKYMIDSIKILEKAKTSKLKSDALNLDKNRDKEDVWSKIGDFFNPFKCGKN